MSCETDMNINKFMIVAHQGYWKAADGAQNSIKALNEAARLKIDGVEFDVRLTKDNYLILHHDAIAGDYIIANSKLSDIRTLRLSDGSLIPTLVEYFEVAKRHKDLDLYIDVKTVESVKPVIDMVMKYELDDKTILLLPFDLGLSAIAYNSNIRVHCLNGSKTPSELKAYGFSGMSYEIDFMKKHVDWIEQAHSVGLMVGCWLIKSESEIIWCSINKIDYVTTDSPLECKHYLYQ